MNNNDDLNQMSFMDEQYGEIVKCVHSAGKVSRSDIARCDSHCPRCDRHLDMDEEPYA